MMRELERACQSHCCPRTVKTFDKYDRVITTYRDPYLVGRSWASRYPWKEVEREWLTQWESWGELIDKGAQIARVDEFTGDVVKKTPENNIYKAITKTMGTDEYYEFVPKDLIDYAAGIANARHL